MADALRLGKLCFAPTQLLLGALSFRDVAGDAFHAGGFARSLDQTRVNFKSQSPAAFGDNLAQAATLAAAPLGLGETQLARLQELGECLNYNGYGETLGDLHYAPDELYRIVHQYRDPFALIAEEPAFRVLKQGFAEDMSKADNAEAEIDRPGGRIFVLPAEKWARRISGVFGNQLAVESPAQAHAVLTAKPGGGYVVSVRAPLATKSGADQLCSQFETGGGRKGAAGINHLPEAELGRFIATFYAVFTRS